jgi:dienelactone hydrolase
MGRSQIRWWQDSFKGRPTVTQVDKVAHFAKQQGYAVIAIDARYHGQRKKPTRPLASIMRDMHLWGDKQDYERMIMDTVLDYRILVDWLMTQPQFDHHNISVVGYSMGAQISLLLGAIDNRINRILAIVPPYIDNKTALVSPQNWLDGLAKKQVVLVTANNDEYATEQQNKTLFERLPSNIKQHITFEGSHILPDNYVNKIKLFF